MHGFSSNLELEVPHPEEICTENFVCFCSCSGSFELLYRCLKTAGVFYSCKIHTCLSHAQGFFFSWATRHTTLCLDTPVKYTLVRVPATPKVSFIFLAGPHDTLPCVLITFRLHNTVCFHANIKRLHLQVTLLTIFLVIALPLLLN